MGKQEKQVGEQHQVGDEVLDSLPLVLNQNLDTPESEDVNIFDLNSSQLVKELTAFLVKRVEARNVEIEQLDALLEATRVEHLFFQLNLVLPRVS